MFLVNGRQFLVGDGVIQHYGLELGKWLVDGFGQRFVGCEGQFVVAFDLYGFAGVNVHAFAGLNWSQLKGPDALDLDCFAVDKRLGHGREQFFNKQFTHSLGR